MIEDAPKFRGLARRLLQREAGGSRDPVALAGAATGVWEKLHGQLAPLVGSLGFQAIALRALREAQDEFPLLSGIALSAQEYAPLVDLRGQAQGQDPQQVAEAITAIVGDFLALLFDLLGRDLSGRLLNAAWPGVGFQNGSPVGGK